MITGFSGHLFSEQFLEQRMARLSPVVETPGSPDSSGCRGFLHHGYEWAPSPRFSAAASDRETAARAYAELRANWHAADAGIPGREELERFLATAASSE